MKAINNFLPILIGVITILSISSCNKDKDDINNNGTTHLSVSFLDGYSNDYGWVVLHNLEGTEVIDYKKIEGDGIADFGEINGGIATTTTIRVDTFMNYNGYKSTYINIASDLASPCGNWIFRGNNNSDVPLGMADITITYPENNYNEYFLTNTNTWDYSEEVPSGVIHNQYDVHYLDDGNKFSVYGAVILNDGGFCNWQIDQDFQLNQINYYNLNLSKPLDKINFVTSKPLKMLYLWGYWNQRKSNLLLYRKFWESLPNGLTNHDVYFPINMTLSNVRFNGYYYDDNNYYIYNKFYNMPQGIPDNIDIPDKTITALYNESLNEVINIEINGTADQIHATWDYYELLLWTS
jgi:hypothetical protein